MQIASKRDSLLARTVGSFFAWFGELGVFFVRTIRNGFAPPYELRELIRQMDEIGSKSLPLVLLAGAALGVVISLQLHDALNRFGGKSLLPGVIVLSIVKESGPIITALVVCGRVSAGIGAELGSMKVTEQIDALEASAIDPFKLLIITRVLACTLVLPILTTLACAIGIFMGWLADTLTEPISLKLFIQQGFEQLVFKDYFPAILKTSVFGLLIGLIGSFQGMRTEKGTEGVGRAATSAVVLASLFIILADVVLVRLIQVFIVS
jgi:phospholipid/cholesterol/gamma-HCH transport system permease protein